MFRKVGTKTKLYGVTLQVILRTSALLRICLIQKPTFSTFLEKGYYVCDVNLLAVMLLKLKLIESEQGKQTIITYVCHCVKACFTAVNIGLAIPRSTFEIPRDYLSNPWLNVATFHPFTRKTSDSRRVLFGICSCGQSPCSFRYIFTVLFTGIKDDHGKFIKQELYGMKFYCQCYQRNFQLNVIVLLHLHGAM